LTPKQVKTLSPTQISGLLNSGTAASLSADTVKALAAQGLFQGALELAGGSAIARPLQPVVQTQLRVPLALPSQVVAPFRPASVDDDTK
jgi:hypothetical protein